MGNNLKYARELMIEPTTEQDTADAQAFALIAIAEQLEIANKIRAGEHLERWDASGNIAAEVLEAGCEHEFGETQSATWGNYRRCKKCGRQERSRPT